jgi:hypothetical protein
VEIAFKIFPLQFLLSIGLMPYMIRSELASLVKKLFIEEGDSAPPKRPVPGYWWYEWIAIAQ